MHWSYILFVIYLHPFLELNLSVCNSYTGKLGCRGNPGKVMNWVLAVCPLCHLRPWPLRPHPPSQDPPVVTSASMRCALCRCANLVAVCLQLINPVTRSKVWIGGVLFECCVRKVFPNTFNHTSYLSFFLHRQNCWRKKFTPKICQFFALNL